MADLQLKGITACVVDGIATVFGLGTDGALYLKEGDVWVKQSMRLAETASVTFNAHDGGR